MRRVALLILIAGLGGSCEKPIAGPATAPATQPIATTQIAALPPVTQPDPITLITIDGHAISFPAARIVVKSQNDQLTAMLFSIDPPQAINPDYRGNSFYFDLKDLQLDDPTSINGASWIYKADSSERQDTVNGIFLQGRGYQLQPFDVKLAVDGELSPVHISMSGTFLMFAIDGNGQQPGQMIKVSAEFPAELKR